MSEYDCLLALHVSFASTNAGLPEFDHSARLQGLNNVLQHQMVPGYSEFQYLNTTLSCASAQARALRHHVLMQPFSTPVQGSNKKK